MRSRLGWGSLARSTVGLGRSSSAPGGCRAGNCCWGWRRRNWPARTASRGWTGSGPTRGRLFAVTDAVAGGHQVELARNDHLLVAEAVAVQDLYLDEPGDGLQADVRARTHVQTGVLRHAGGTHVVGEAPGADGAAPAARQCTTHVNAPDRRVVALRDLDTGRCDRPPIGHRRGVVHADRTAHGITVSARRERSTRSSRHTAGVSG